MHCHSAALGDSAAVIRMFFTGKFPWRKVPHYMLAQFLGAFAGAALVYGVYFEALHEVEDKFYDGERLVNATAGIFATYPQPHLSIGGGFVDQVPLPSGSLRTLPDKFVQSSCGLRGQCFPSMFCSSSDCLPWGC